jgi:putative peptide zinc metalloprotease protein
MGIMLLVFFPVPYVDSSAANRFSSSKRRMLVASAGIMVEVFLASLAMLLWVNLEAGLLQDLAFDIIIIGGVSTLLFNANPLLRFDGYYIFSELIEIPNLAGRSVQYLGYLLKTYLLDLPAQRSPVTARGEKKWLIVYGISSMLYRLMISIVIALWVGGKFFIIGTILAIWALLSQILYPFIVNFYRLIPQVRAARRLPRLGVVVVSLIALLLTVLLYPVGHSSYAEGIINLPEKALLRAGADGIIRNIHVSDGSRVEAEQTILTLENLDLALRSEILQARLEEARARQLDVILLDRTQAEILKSRVLALESELTDVEDQLHNLQLNSAIRGSLYLPGVADLPGRFVGRGEVVGYVADLRQLTAKVVIPQRLIDAVRSETQHIQVRFLSRPDEIISARFLRELPQATDRLPSRLLGTGGGGDIAIDVRDETGVQSIANTFQVEIALPVRSSGNYLGQTVLVRFIHPKKSLASQLLNIFDQFLLQEPFV